MNLARCIIYIFSLLLVASLASPAENIVVSAQTGQPEIGENSPVKLNDIGADQYIDIESLNYSLDNRGNIEAEVSFTSQVQNTVYTLQLGEKLPSYNMDGYSGYISLDSGDSYTEILEKHVTEFEGGQACIKGTEILDYTCIDIQSHKDRWKEILSNNPPDISLTDSDSEITAEIAYQDIEEMGSLGGYQVSLRQENRNGQREIGPSNYNPPRYTGTVQKLLDKTTVSSLKAEDSIKTDKQTVTGNQVCVYVYGVNTGKCVNLGQSRDIELRSDEYSYSEEVQVEYSLRDTSKDYYILTNGIDPESSPIYFDKEETELENTEGTVTVQTPQRGTGFQAWLIVGSDSVKGNVQGDVSKDLIASRDTATLSDNTETDQDEPEEGTFEVELNPLDYKNNQGIAIFALPVNGEVPLSQLSDDCPIVGDQVYGYESGGTETSTLNGMRGYATVTENTQSCTATVERSAVSGNLDLDLPNNEWVVASVPRQMDMSELEIGQSCTFNGIDDTQIWEITNQGNQALDEGATLEPSGLYWIRAQGEDCQIGSDDEIFENPG